MIKLIHIHREHQVLLKWFDRFLWAAYHRKSIGGALNYKEYSLIKSFKCALWFGKYSKGHLISCDFILELERTTPDSGK